jgi:hypothetical protein
MIAAALFLPLFNGGDEVQTVQISDVSLISTEEFLSMQAPAPKAAVTAPALPEQAMPKDQVAILQPEPEPAPTPAPPPPAIVEPVTEPDPPAPDVGVLIEQPTAMPAIEDQAGEDKPEPPQPDATPAPRPRVASENNPEAPTDAEVAKEVEKASVESETADKPVEATTEKAPKQSSTEIVTEAEKPEETLAPVKSVRPKSRPADLLTRREEPEPEPEVTPEPEKVAKAEPKPKPAPKPVESPEDLIAKQIAADMAAAAKQTATAGPGGAGQALTDTERKGLVVAVQDCWSVPIGIQNASELVVTLAVDLAPNGGLSSSPKLIEPSSADGQIQQAFEAARRALIACAPYDLPPEKYETWKRLEVVFNPKNMVLR